MVNWRALPLDLTPEPIKCLFCLVEQAARRLSQLVYGCLMCLAYRS